MMRWFSITFHFSRANLSSSDFFKRETLRKQRRRLTGFRNNNLLLVFFECLLIVFWTHIRVDACWFIELCYTGFVGVLIFLAYNFHKRRSRGGKNYSNFHNPSYRKKSPHQNGKAAPFPSGIARNSSQAELMEVHSYSDQESGRNRIGSQDSSESPGSSNEHVYHPVSFTS